ncbi:MAG: DUF4010 domain-containing protein, partial [Anaerolineales bacterium]|nr:DUF4010 domain-containing protein [Anaerolineales bacterium]
DLSKPLVLAITVAWTVMFGRVLVEVGVLNPPLLRMIWIPIAASALVGLLYCVYLFIYSRQHKEKSEVEFSNPFDLGAAIKFGLIYAGVLLVSRAAQLYLGDPGVILSSVISGAADVDAVTLSLAELSSNGGLSMEVAGRGILLATMSNTATKGAIALLGGSLALRKPLLIAVGSMLLVGLGVGLFIL